MKQQRVFHFSGGRSSAYMVLNYYRPGDLVLFADTGREHPKTYKFVHDFEAHEGIPVIWVKHKGGFRDVIKKESMVPNHFKRKCTIILKVKAQRRHLRSLGWFRYTSMVGFRYDEPQRVTRYQERWQAVTTIFPLFEDKVTRSTINEFWASKPYRLELPQILSNCTLCFEKGKAAIIAILTNYPEYADEWIADEEDAVLNPHGYPYIAKTKYRQLLNAALELREQGKVYNLETMEPQFNCACTA